MNAVIERRCNQPGCGGPASGVCIENFSFEECPNVTISNPLESYDGEGFAVPEESGDTAIASFVTTSPGPTFDTIKCDEFLRRRSATVVAVIAGPEVGKTTLLATIYELSRRGRMPEIEFAGSETILGFEQRCYLARESSNLPAPDTPRTRVGGPQYLHIRLLIDGFLADLILADRPGENYTKAIEMPAVLRDYEEVARAEHLLILIDGREFSVNPHSAAASARRFYRGLLQNGLRQDQHVHLVFTKADLFSGEELDDFDEHAKQLWEELKSRSGQHTVHLRITGARARLGSDVFGEGIADLTRALVRVPKERNFQSLYLSAVGDRTSMLDNLMRRRMVDQ